MNGITRTGIVNGVGTFNISTENKVAILPLEYKAKDVITGTVFSSQNIKARINEENRNINLYCATSGTYQISFTIVYNY